MKYGWKFKKKDAGFDFGILRDMLEHSFFEFIKDTLTNLDLLDTRKRNIDSAGKTGSSMSGNTFPQIINGAESEDKVSVFSVHHEINGQYGDFLKKN